VASLDSTFLIDLLRGDLGAQNRLRELEKSREPRCVTPPAAAEVLVGANRGARELLEAAKGLLATLTRLEFDSEAARLAGRIGADLIARGQPLPGPDLFIAAVSLRHGQPPLTRDHGFARGKGLRVETY
jgi:tRNA(fMet)-specific endonuclease VapC